MPQILLAAVNDSTAPAGGGAGGGVVGIRLKDATGAFVGTISFEGNIGGVWVPIEAFPLAGGASVTSATANGQWRIKTSGTAGVRARLSAITTLDGATLSWEVTSDGSL